MKCLPGGSGAAADADGCSCQGSAAEAVRTKVTCSFHTGGIDHTPIEGGGGADESAPAKRHSVSRTTSRSPLDLAMIVEGGGGSNMLSL